MLREVYKCSHIQTMLNNLTADKLALTGLHSRAVGMHVDWNASPLTQRPSNNVNLTELIRINKGGIHYEFNSCLGNKYNGYSLKVRI